MQVAVPLAGEVIEIQITAVKHMTPVLIRHGTVRLNPIYPLAVLIEITVFKKGIHINPLVKSEV